MLRRKLAQLEGADLHNADLHTLSHGGGSRLAQVFAHCLLPTDNEGQPTGNTQAIIYILCVFPRNNATHTYSTFGARTTFYIIHESKSTRTYNVVIVSLQVTKFIGGDVVSTSRDLLLGYQGIS